MEAGQAYVSRYLLAPQGFYKFLKREATLNPRKALTMAAIAGLGNALILAVVNSAAAHAQQSETRPLYAVAFGAAMLMYVISQRWIITKSAEQIEAIIHRVRVRIINQFQYCELLDVEGLGRPVIYNGLALHMSTLTMSAPAVTVIVQNCILIVCTTAYIAFISLTAFFVLIAFMAIALNIYWRKHYSTLNEELQSLELDMESYEYVHDYLDGFKETKLNRAKAKAIITHIEEISAEAARTRASLQYMRAQNFVFAQSTFYLLLGAMVFVVPVLATSFSDVVLKSTTAVLFIIGPISAVVGSLPMFQNASVAAEAIMDLELNLKELSSVELEFGDDGRPLDDVPSVRESPFLDFKTIKFQGVVFKYSMLGDSPNDNFSVGPIDLTINRGEFLFITGGNGSGKSTLLRMLTGLYSLDEGKILVDGKTLQPEMLQDFREIFAAVFSDFHLFSQLYGIADEVLIEAEEWADFLEIHHKVKIEGRNFSTVDLSSGQRKRLALLGALLEHRPVLVLDEWAADQDPLFRRKFYREVLPKLQNLGMTIISVTHDNRFFDAADRQIHMEDGILGTFNPEHYHD